MVLANLNDVVFQTDREGHYTYLNAAWEAKTGHGIGDSVGGTASPSPRATWRRSGRSCSH